MIFVYVGEERNDMTIFHQKAGSCCTLLTLNKNTRQSTGIPAFSIREVWKRKLHDLNRQSSNPDLYSEFITSPSI